MYLFSSHVKSCISTNVVDSIMGSYVFVAMGTMSEVDTSRVNGGV